ncbi:hypothetical protein OG372_20900 [Streptomyces sp. NBC_01020]|uniref:hypothetical protein n=1 Tax=unclassified Streptomyces TaxID=2593676 RepID=UPI00224FB6A0|nr:MULTISPECIES: hypothetical protein [unclassified Streptomyces]MCX4724700.1 hypothetical protein [Streptomyces sp. NBC_01306]WSV05812.1 hypothetical protein OG372_20900 [Streptomyces sp. NBC_01020]WSX43898.1 hypothetical protein OG760_20640 [Streptomyces sp. NBC_00963]WSX68056.1 hypothetical protein OG221_16260 [Streptomyces sp. NBC_00932]
MNVRRILTTAAAGSALLAAFAPAAQASSLGGTLSDTAQTTAAVGEQAKPIAKSVVGNNVGKKVHAVKGAAKAGGDALKAGNELLSS